jgi:actin-related protein
MERLLRHTFFNELRVSPEEHPVLLSESPLNPPDKRERMAQLLFETFNVPACHLAVDAMLGLLCSGHTQGIAVDLGHSHAHAVPFGEVSAASLPGFDPAPRLNNRAPDQSTIRLPEMMSPPVRISCGAGGVLSQELRHRLRGRNEVETLLTSRDAEREIFRDMKEVCCQVTSRAELDAGRFPGKAYELPDGVEVVLDHRCRSVPDLLFTPSLMTLDSDTDPIVIRDFRDDVGIVDAVVNAASANPADLYKNVFLMGSTSMFANLTQRLQQELSARVVDHDVTVIGGPDRKYAPWIGGSILASLSIMNHLWVTQRHYDEDGPQVISSRWPPPSQKFATGALTKAAGKTDNIA